MEIYAETNSDQAFFTICSVRYKEHAEAVVKAEISSGGMIITNVSFCNLISKLSAETIIEEVNGELIISTSETKYKLPLL